MKSSGRKAKTAPARDAQIAIVIENPEWRQARLGPALRRAAALVLAREEIEGGLTILLTDDAALQRLNREFRGKDKPTNVLSFPAPENPEDHLGDIAIAHGVAAAEARAAGKRLADHVSHLAVHGVLHLLGYDHEDDDEAEMMERREADLLAELGIADPYSLPA